MNRMGQKEIIRHRPSCSCHGFAMQLPCVCHAFAMRLPCGCHAFAMRLPCVLQRDDKCHAFAISLQSARRLARVATPQPGYGLDARRPRGCLDARDCIDHVLCRGPLPSMRMVESLRHTPDQPWTDQTTGSQNSDLDLSNIRLRHRRVGETDGSVAQRHRGQLLVCTIGARLGAQRIY